MNYQVASLTVNMGCAAVNLYLAPKTFSLSFAVGLLMGSASALASRVQFAKVDLSEKGTKVLKEKTHFDERVQVVVQETRFGRAIAKAKPYLDVGLDIVLFFSGYGKLFGTAKDLFCDHDKQKKDIMRKLNPTPRVAGTLLSITSAASNLGYIAQPILSKVSIFSGYTMGYASGLHFVKNSRYGRTDSYNQYLAQEGA